MNETLRPTLAEGGLSGQPGGSPDPTGDLVATPSVDARRHPLTRGDWTGHSLEEFGVF